MPRRPALLDAATRRFTIDLLAAIDAAQGRGTVALRVAAPILSCRALLAAATATWPSAALPDVGTLGALSDVGSLPALARARTAGIRPAGSLAAELLALLGARTMLAVLLACRSVPIGDATSMA
jgi:hypothetical protein